MIDGTQMTLDFLTSQSQKDSSATPVYNIPYPNQRQETFDFGQLFINGVDAKEIHLGNAMAILGDSLEILK